MSPVVIHVFIFVVQSLSGVWFFATLWTTTHQASSSFTISGNLLKFMSVQLIMPSNHFILCCPLLFLPSIFLSIRVFSSEWALCIRWPKYWSFSFSISPSNEYSGLISFRMDWFDLCAFQGILKARILEWVAFPFSRDDKSRQCIKKQRHHFANKGLHSQSYGFSSSHVHDMTAGP